MSARARTIVVAASLALAAGAFLAARLAVDSDFAAFLPRGTDARQQWLLDQLREGPAARLIVAGIAGGSLDDRVAASEALVRALADAPEFAYATNGAPNLASKDLDVLAAHRYALSPSMEPARFSTAGLRQALEDGLVALQGSFALVEKTFLWRDPTGETSALLRRLAGDARIRREQGVWVDATGDRALLVVQTKAGGADLEGQAAAIAALDRAFDKVATPGLTLVRSSPGTMAVDSRAVVERDARRVSLLSGAGVLLVLLVAYRSLPVVAICFVPAALGLLAGACAVQAAFGSVHAITLAFGATLLGEAVDYPSYLLTSGAGTLAPDERRSAIGRAMGLAVATTACGSLALLLSGFDGLVQLGTMTAVGILAGGAATWWLVPSLVPAGWTFGPGRLRAPAVRWRMPAAVATAVFVLASVASIAVLATGSRWDDDPARLNPLPAALAARDRSLREAVGAPDARYVAVVRAPTLQGALERTESLAPLLADAVASKRLAGYRLVTDDLPSDATQRRRLDALPDADALRERIAEASRGLPYRPGAFEPFVREASAEKQGPPLRAEDYAGTGIALRVQPLVASDPAGTRVLVPLSGVADAEAVRATLARAGGDVELVDLREEVGSLLGAFRQRALVATGAGVALIYAILALGLRSPARALRVIAPAVLATLWTLAALAGTGHALTIFHLIAALLVIGVGVNYMLFAFPAPGERVSATILPSLAVVSATTLVAFGSMATSSIPVLRAIGATVTLGVAATLVACALVIGAMRSRA